MSYKCLRWFYNPAINENMLDGGERSLEAFSMDEIHF